MQAEAGQSWMELITVALAGVGGTAKRIWVGPKRSLIGWPCSPQTHFIWVLSNCFTNILMVLINAVTLLTIVIRVFKRIHKCPLNWI
jgi:hypothetical protein